MRHVRFVAGFATGCATILLAAAAFNTQDHPRQDHPRQEHPQQPPTQEQMEQMWAEAVEKYGSPSAEHEMLAKRVGAWNFRGEHFQAPDTAAEEFQGTATYEMLMDGRYLLGHYNSPMGEGVTFEGGGLTGYDRLSQEYQSVWIDNMSTAIAWSTGGSKDAGKTLEFSGEMPDIFSGKYVKSRMVERWVDENNWVMESYGPSPVDGKEFLTMRITYTRAQ